VHCDLARSSCKELLAQVDATAPSFLITARLPALSCSLSESKLKSLIRCTSFSNDSSAAAMPTTVANEGGATRAIKKRIGNMDRRLMCGVFTIDAVAVALYTGALEQDRLASLRIMGIHAEVQQRPCDEMVKFNVQSIVAEDHTQPERSDFRVLLSTESTNSDPFLQVSYTHIVFSSSKVSVSPPHCCAHA
jgi:hypothetical protein